MNVISSKYAAIVDGEHTGLAGCSNAKDCMRADQCMRADRQLDRALRVTAPQTGYDCRLFIPYVTA